MEPAITSVWHYNLFQELQDMDSAMNFFRVVSVDTEFPGLLATTRKDASEFERYKNLKFSIDRTNLIQLGVTLSTDCGRIYRSWEFNFKFDIGRENYNEESIKFLEKNGLKLELLMKCGIDMRKFSKLFARIVCKHANLEWVTFHGVHDMAHLLKLVTNSRLPRRAFKFAEVTGCIFGRVVDIKYVTTLCEDLDGGGLGLEKLAKKLGVVRYGRAHNAGSDSLLTAMVYTAMKSVYCLVENNMYGSFLYGISAKIEIPKEPFPLPDKCFAVPAFTTSHYKYVSFH